MVTTLKSDSGFTIVELLITLAVGAIFVTSLNSIVISQSYLGQRGRDVVIANAYAESKAEELRSIGFLGLSYGTTSITSELPSELKSASGSLVISSHSVSVKKAFMTISYSAQGTPRTISYTTLIGELGVGQY